MKLSIIHQSISPSCFCFFVVVLITIISVLQRDMKGGKMIVTFAEALTAATTTSTTTTTISKGRRNEGIAYKVLYASSSNNNVVESDNSEEEDAESSSSLLMETISGEEALLACQAYLRKKRKLPWQQFEQRLQYQQKRSSTTGGVVGEEDDDGIGDYEGRGYFWDNPLELKYLSRGGKRKILEDDFEEDYNMMEDDEENDEDELSQALLEEEEDEEENERNDASEDYSRVLIKSYDESPFTSYPLYPPLEHIRRSTAAKKTWNDDKWKAKWYKQRWGNKISDLSSKEKRKQNKIAHRVSNIPNDVLMSSELQNLSDEEVQEAIQMYVVANKKRSESHLKRAREMKERRERSLSEDMKILQSGDKDVGKEKENKEEQEEQKKKQVVLSFEIPGSVGGTLEEQMREKQRQRAEVAKRAYQTRLKNKQKQKQQQQQQQQQQIEEQDSKEKSKSKTTKKPRKKTSVKKNQKRKVSVATTTTTRINSNTATAKANASLDKIVDDLNSNVLPSTYDVTQILLPGRLSLRRKVLVRLLSDCFDLRGKCIPDYGLLEEWEEENGKDMKVMMMKEEEVPMQFATHCPIQDLGEFVLEKLSEAGEEEGEKS